MLVIYDLGGQRYRVFVKGASEIVLRLCTQELTKEGRVVMLDKKRAD